MTIFGCRKVIFYNTVSLDVFFYLLRFAIQRGPANFEGEGNRV